MAGSRSEPWKVEELVRALSLYCVLPFGRFHKSTPEVCALAREIGRSPSAVALKLSNFASFDPFHKSRGVSGMGNASRLDREVWDEYYGRWTLLAEAVHVETKAELEGEGEFAVPSGPTTARRLLETRRGQHFFRRAVLAAYEGECCITGIAHPRLLRASHIVPWADSEDHRLNPQNGLALNALHDAAFDKGLISLDEELRVMVSPQLVGSMPSATYEANFARFAGCRIRMPSRFHPDRDLVEIHRSRTFVR